MGALQIDTKGSLSHCAGSLILGLRKTFEQKKHAFGVLDTPNLFLHFFRHEGDRLRAPGVRRQKIALHLHDLLVAL